MKTRQHAIYLEDGVIGTLSLHFGSTPKSHSELVIRAWAGLAQETKGRKYYGLLHSRDKRLGPGAQKALQLSQRQSSCHMMH